MRLMTLYFSTIKQLVEDTPKFHKPWQGPFKVVEVLGPTVYRIAECANPRRQKVVHFYRLKPGPAEAESQPPPEVILWPMHTKTANRSCGCST